jgi:hypothetical protein
MKRLAKAGFFLFPSGQTAKALKTGFYLLPLRFFFTLSFNRAFYIWA